MKVTIRFIDKEKIDSIIPLLRQLNANISEDVLRNRLKNMVLQGYQCVGVFDADNLIGISGIWVLHKYYIGKHIEPDNVCILPEYQGKGIGGMLMKWIYEYGKSIGCEASELNCYTGNKAGQRFWKEQGYEIVGYHYRKKFTK
ncbi:MAG: GNAT family N-acetyltransferase [Pricia sp.]